MFYQHAASNFPLHLLTGLHKNRAEDSYTYQVPVDTSHTPYSKGKLKDLQLYKQENSGHGRKKPRKPDRSSAPSMMTSQSIWTLGLSYLALLHHAHLL